MAEDSIVSLTSMIIGVKKVAGPKEIRSLEQSIATLMKIRLEKDSVLVVVREIP